MDAEQYATYESQEGRSLTRIRQTKGYLIYCMNN